MCNAPVHRRLRLAPLSVLLALLLATAANARAEEPPEEKLAAERPLAEKVVLEYVRGKGCPSGRVLRHAILSRMKVDPFSALAKAKLRVVIAAVGEMFQASYEIIDSDGEVVLPRTMALREKCALALEDLALSVSVHLPMLITGPLPEAERPSAGTEDPGASSTKAHVRLDGGILWSVGTAPGGGAFGFSAHTALRWPKYSVSLGLRYDSFSSDGEKGFPLGVSRVVGEVVPCLHRFDGFVACGLAQVAQFILRDPKARSSWPSPFPLPYVGVRFGGEWPLTVLSLPRLSAYLSADFTVSPMQAWFTAANLKGSWITPIFSASVGGGVSYLF